MKHEPGSVEADMAADRRAFLRMAEMLAPHDDSGEAARPKRQRKPSIASAIKQARKAGERGPVRVTLPDGTSVTSEREGSDAAATVNPWDKVLMTDATH